MGRCARHDASPVLSRPAQGVGLGAVSNGDGRMSKFPMVGFSSFVGHDPSPFSGHERTTGSLSNPQHYLGGHRQATEVPKKDLRQETSAEHGQGFVRVGQLESALKALDPSTLHAASLQEVLKRAQFQARVLPIESRAKVAEEHLARKQKRLLEAEGAVVAAIEGRDRLKA